MKTAALVLAALGGSLVSARELSTEYTADRALRVETTTSFRLEPTVTEMLRDGEPIEGRGGGGGSKGSHSSVVVERYLECAAGRPLRVRRSYESVAGETERSMRGEPVSESIDSPFDGVTVEISSDEDGEVTAEVVEGSGPEDDALEALRPALTLDALLPGEDVEAGATWDLSPEAIRHALGLDLAAAMYPRPERGGGGGERRGGGGGRGGWRGMGGGSIAQQLAGAEWSGTARLNEDLEEHEGTNCAVVAVVLEGSYENDEMEGVSSSFSVELEGLLHVAVDGRRPVLFEIEGPIATELDMEREREGTLMEIHRESEGMFSLRVAISDTPFEDD